MVFKTWVFKQFACFIIMIEYIGEIFVFSSDFSTYAAETFRNWSIASPRDVDNQRRQDDCKNYEYHVETVI